MKEQEVLEAKKIFPSISIILPVNKKYPHFKDDEARLKAMVKDAEEKLRAELAAGMAKEVIEKLEETVALLDFRQMSEGLAIYVSPRFQKIIHLPFPVTEKLVIGRTFEIRDLLYAAKHDDEYGVLAVSEKKVRLFRGENGRLIEFTDKNMPYGTGDTGGKGRSRTASFSSYSSSKNVSDAQAFKEEQMEKYLREIDRVLSARLKEKHVPVIVCGVKKEIARFRSLTKNKENIIGYVTGNFDHVSASGIEERVRHVLERMHETNEKKVLGLLEEAVSRKTFASGIREVWKAAMEKRGRLVVVEKDYRCAGKTGKDKYSLITGGPAADDALLLKDAVDEVMEIVLQNGGDVAFVKDGLLEEHGHIALVTFY